MSDGQVIPVRIQNHAYDITVRPGLLENIGDLLAKLTPARRAAIVTDTQVGPKWLAPVRESLQHAGFQIIEAIIPAGERNKNLPALMPVYDRLLTFGMERSTPVLALGGGIVTDMAGFVAATILRGVPLVQIPTSLLAMVDASIGGKTGVDHAVGKNLIGAFHQPIAVLIDPAVLATLPDDELKNGLAECIKHDLIRDADGFARLEKQIAAIINRDVDALTNLVAHNAAIKARVVQSDPFERGERAHLNFGHTFGHAIEAVSDFSIPHGQAVALGMTAAAYASAKLSLIDELSQDRIVTLIREAGLPTSGLRADVDKVVSAMRFDKKNTAGRLRFILLDKIGHAVIRDDLPLTLVREAVASLREP